MSENKLFDDSIKDGVLILVKPDETKKCKCILWFDFTMQSMRDIVQGDLIAIQNFNTDSKSTYYSIFRLTEVHPSHYALTEKDLNAYPGNIEESARNIFPDYTEQESESTEDLTKINCEAFPINLQYLDKGEELKRENLSEDDSLPITGSEVKLVSKELTELIYNSGIDKTDDSIVTLASLIKNDDVKILVNSDEMIKVHFGIFGYTGAGKSNLLSTIISTVLVDSKTKCKFILFDIMDEYTGLLFDQLLNTDVNGMIISLGQNYLPTSVLNYLNSKNASLLDIAAEDFLKGMLLPKKLREFRDKYLPFIKTLLETDKIKIIDAQVSQTVEQFSQGFWNDIFDEHIVGPTKMDLERALNDIFRDSEESTRELNDDMAKLLDGKLENEIKKDDRGNEIKMGRDKTFNERIRAVQQYLKNVISKKSELPETVKFSIDKIIAELNDNSKKSLLLLTSNNPDVMRSHAKKIGNYIYLRRNSTATISPLISFIFDEADEFIPQGASGSKAESREIVEKLARRGRKFGLGVGLATQRITYLDTNIMGQPHTYFVSKLPRRSDREKVGEAFGLIEDDFKQTFRFKKGHWMLISHDATGIESEPIPVHTDNAEDRIMKFLGMTKDKD